MKLSDDVFRFDWNGYEQRLSFGRGQCLCRGHDSLSQVILFRNTINAFFCFLVDECRFLLAEIGAVFADGNCCCYVGDYGLYILGKQREKFSWPDKNLHPQNLAVMQTRAE